MFATSIQNLNVELLKCVMLSGIFGDRMLKIWGPNAQRQHSCGGDVHVSVNAIESVAQRGQKRGEVSRGGGGE